MVKKAKLISIFAMIIGNVFGNSKSPGIFSGSIIDNFTEKPLRAVVIINELSISAVTDSTGIFYFENINPGLYTIVAFSTGYDSSCVYNVLIKSGTNNNILIRLHKSLALGSLPTLTVVASSVPKTAAQINSISKFSHYELNNTAGTLNDVMRTLGTSPSTVSGVGEGFRNSLVVRGGDPVENTLLIDGMELESINHYSLNGNGSGITSTLNSNLIDYLDFYVGAIPANLSSSISSVADIYLREGSYNCWKSRIDLNFAGLGLLSEGPIHKNKLSYLADFRMVDLRFLNKIVEIDGLPFWGDAHIKLGFKPANQDRLLLNFMYSFDHYLNENEYDRFEIAKTKNVSKTYFYAGNIAWKHLLNSVNGKNNLTIFWTNREDSESEELKSNLENGKIRNWPNLINQSIDSSFTQNLQSGRKRIYTEKDANENSFTKSVLCIKDDFSIFLQENNQLNFGLSGRYLRYLLKEKTSYIDSEIVFAVDTFTTPDNVYPYLFRVNFSPYNQEINLDGFSLHGYLQYVLFVNWFKMITGVRGEYSSILRDYSFSPGLALMVQTDNAGNFSISGGLYHQVHSKLQNIITEFFLTDNHIKSYELKFQRNWQAVLG